MKVGDTTLTVRIQEDLERLVEDAAPRALEEARRLLNIAHNMVSREGPPPPNVVALAHHYFRTGMERIPDDKWQEIRKIIKDTRDGLAGEVWLKIGKSIKGPGTENVSGRVRSHYDAPARTDKDVSHNTYVASHDPRHRFSKNDPDTTMRWGAIHLKAGVLASVDGALTLIHEATHKYAGTFDFAYFDKDGRRGEILIAGDHDFDNSDLTIWNADSYAWFVVKVAASS